MRVDGRDALAAAMLFGVAFSIRLLLLHSAPYGDEAGHYAISKTLGIWGDDDITIAGGEPFDLSPWVFGRPTFAFVYAPGTWMGFEAFRIEASLIAATIPVLAFAWLRRQSTGRIMAGMAGVVLALHPVLVVWGARVFPDSLMAALFLGGMLAWDLGRRRTALLFFLASCLAKETAIVALGSYALGQYIHERQEKTNHHGAGQLAAVALAGTVAGWAAYSYAGGTPGWARGGDGLAGLESVLWSSWLVLPMLAGLAIPATRQLATTVGGLVAFYVAYIILRNGQVQAWYAVLPLTLATLLCARLLALGWRSTGRSWLVSRFVAVGAVFLVLSSLLGGTALAHPVSPAEDPGLPSSIQFVRAEGSDLAAARDHHARLDPARVFMVDVLWYNTFYPFHGHESTVISYPLVLTDATTPWTAMESAMRQADVVWLQWWDGGFEVRFDQAFQHCRSFSEGIYRAYVVADCEAASMDAFWAAERARANAQ